MGLQSATFKPSGIKLSLASSSSNSVQWKVANNMYVYICQYPIILLRGEVHSETIKYLVQEHTVMLVHAGLEPGLLIH